MSEEMDLPEDFYDDDGDDGRMFDYCTFCGREYDAIDYEYQICHHCKKSAQTTPKLTSINTYKIKEI